MNRRESSSRRGYGSRWRKARAVFLDKNPLCVHCQRVGVVTAATDVDHIKPHKGDEGLFWDESNWQPLCHSCHSRKTVVEDGGFGNEKGKAMVSGGKTNGFPLDPQHHWYK